MLVLDGRIRGSPATESGTPPGRPPLNRHDCRLYRGLSIGARGWCQRPASSAPQVDVMTTQCQGSYDRYDLSVGRENPASIMIGERTHRWRERTYNQRGPGSRQDQSEGRQRWDSERWPRRSKDSGWMDSGGHCSKATRSPIRAAEINVGSEHRAHHRSGSQGLRARGLSRSRCGGHRQRGWCRGEGSYYTYFPSKLEVFKVLASRVGKQIREAVVIQPEDTTLNPSKRWIIRIAGTSMSTARTPPSTD